MDLQTGDLHAEISFSDLNPESPMQDMAQKMLSEAADALSLADARELRQLVQQAEVAKPLWDGQPIQNRPSPSSAQAVDEGDNAPASWDYDQDTTMPAKSQSQVQEKSVPQTPSQSQDTGAVSASLHGTTSRGNSLDDPQSGSIPSQAITTAAELEAKMAKLKEKIAAKKAAAAAAAAAATRNKLPASGDTSAVTSDTAPEVSATAQAKPKPSCSVAAAASNSGAMQVEPARASGAVFSSVMYASNHLSHTSDKTCRHLPSLTLPVLDSSQTWHAAHASSHSACPGDSKDGFQAANQAFANTARPQADHVGGVPPAVPVATSINASHRSAQGCFSDQPAGPHSAPPLASTPSVSQMQSEQEAQMQQSSQAHFDPHSWGFVQSWRDGQSPQDTSMRTSADAKARDSKPLDAAHTPLMPSQHTAEGQQGLHCHYNHPPHVSDAAAAAAATTRRIQILNGHAPHVLQHTAYKDMDSNLRSAVLVSAATPNGSSTCSISSMSVNLAVPQSPSASAQLVHVPAASSPSQDNGTVAADQVENECMVPMEIDATLLSTQMRPSGTSFGDPPRAAFGHPHHQALQMHEASTCDVTNPVNASLAADDHCTDMDIDDDV